MRAHVWRIGGSTIDLERAIQRYDRRTRQVGFHVLNDWDGIADRVNDDTIPVDVLHYLVDRRGSEPATPRVLAILLDYYFMHVLALLTLRVWDEGDADANLELVSGLLAHLQSADGSGQRFAADAETLLLIGTSHYELHERGYHVLLEKVRTLSDAHQLTIALGHASSMGSHLRFGFEAHLRARHHQHARRQRRRLSVALFRAGAPDARIHPASGRGRRQSLRAGGRRGAAERPDRPTLVRSSARRRRSLSGCEVERAGFRDSFLAVRHDLLPEFEPHRPSDAAYSPLCFFFNFSHNVLKGVVIDALLHDRPYPLTFNDLLTAIPRDAPAAALKAEVATMLMGYARDNPHRIRGRLRPVIVYDVQSGREAFSVAMRKMKE